jgi:hypothetical protein
MAADSGSSVGGLWSATIAPPRDTFGGKRVPDFGALVQRNYPERMASSRTPSHATRINRIRVEYWYSRLRHASGLSDKELNCLLQPDAHPEDAKSSKTFERLRKQRTIPSRGRQRKDGVDIVAVMEQFHPGSQGWYEAALWDAVAYPATSRQHAAERVSEQCAAHTLRRTTRGEFLDIAAAWPTLPEEAVYGRTLRRTLTAFSRIDRLGLLVLLYREAELAAEHNVLGELSSQFDEDAGLLFSEALGYDQGAVAYDAILGAVLQAPRSWQPETLGDGGFGDSSCRLPLVRANLSRPQSS